MEELVAPHPDPLPQRGEGEMRWGNWPPLTSALSHQGRGIRAEAKRAPARLEGASRLLTTGLLHFSLGQQLGYRPYSELDMPGLGI